MTSLNRISIAGFKNFAEAQVELGPLNLIIGDHGAGKTNFLEALTMLQAAETGDLERYLARQGGPENVFRRGPDAPNLLRIAARFDDGPEEHGFSLQQTGNGRIHPLPGYEGGIADPTIRKRIRQWSRNEFNQGGHPPPMLKTAALHDNRRLRPDGANLASFIHRLREKHPEAYRDIVERIREVAPFFDEFQPQTSGTAGNFIRLNWRDRETEEIFDLAFLADGIIQFAALTALLLQPQTMRPPLILLDQPEAGLSPKATVQLAKTLRQPAADGAQIIFTVQSPTLLHEFRPEDVILIERNRGAARLGRLYPKRWEPHLSRERLGDLWESGILKL